MHTYSKKINGRVDELVMQSNDKPIGRQALYSMASRHAQKAISRLVKLLDSSNENVMLGAARTLLDKSLPSMKSMELANPGDNEIKVIITDYNGAGGETMQKVFGNLPVEIDVR